MVDVIMVAIILAFFGVAVVFVKACERVIGPDLEAARAGDDATTEVDPERSAA